VIAAIRRDRAAKAAAAAADASVAQLRAGKSLQEVAAARQLAPTVLPGIPRGAPVPDAESAAAFFDAAPAKAGAVIADKVVLSDGRIVVFVVDKVAPGNPKEATADQRAQLQQQLAQLAGTRDAEGLVKALRSRMKIKVAEDRL
jgi:peptidyl-prolyl cis-trans isomerase D